MNETGRNTKRYSPFAVGLLIIAVIVIFFVNNNRNEAVISQISDGMLGVAKGENAVIIQLSDITSVELVSDFEIGRLVNGEDAHNDQKWTYHNDTLGEYRFFAYEQIDLYILVHYTDKTLVFNSNSATNTEKVYENLMSELELLE